MRRIVFLLLISIVSLFGAVNLSVLNGIQSPYKNLIMQLYRLNGGNYLWLNNPSNLEKATKAFENGYYNYKNKPLHRNEITRLLYALDSGALSSLQKDKLDLLVTDAYLRLLKFIRVGDVDWALVKKKLKDLKREHDIHAVWEMRIKGMPSAQTIYSYIRSGRVNTLLSASVGLQQRYKSYIDILQYYRKIPEFRKVPFGKVIKYKQRDKRVYQIKRRLLLLGDFPRSGSINRTFDRDLLYAVRRFRKRFNLRAGDYIDNKLIGYINLPKSYYIKKILVNLDKTKLYPPSFGNTYIEVNVPEFKMRFYESGYERFSSDIVVGRLDRPTPIFSDQLEFVVANPTWNIPENLVKKDLIPALKNNPNLLEEVHIKAYQGRKEVKPDLQRLFSYEHSSRRLPYRFVQQPGALNALGHIKFMFPNKYAVYLHDTPNKGLFSNKYRYNSSGCMRLSDPDGFYSVLMPYMRNPQDIGSLVARGETVRIGLRQKIPVHIVYFTLEFENGAPKFMYDAYMYDKIIEESTAGHKKYHFEVPGVRLREVKS